MPKMKDVNYILKYLKDADMMILFDCTTKDTSKFRIRGQYLYIEELEARVKELSRQYRETKHIFRMVHFKITKNNLLHVCELGDKDDEGIVDRKEFHRLLIYRDIHVFYRCRGRWELLRAHKSNNG